MLLASVLDILDLKADICLQAVSIQKMPTLPSHCSLPVGSATPVHSATRAVSGSSRSSNMAMNAAAQTGVMKFVSRVVYSHPMYIHMLFTSVSMSECSGYVHGPASALIFLVLNACTFLGKPPHRVTDRVCKRHC